MGAAVVGNILKIAPKVLKTAAKKSKKVKKTKKDYRWKPGTKKSSTFSMAI